MSHTTLPVSFHYFVCDAVVMPNITSSWANVIPTEQFHGGVSSSVVLNTLRFPKKEPLLK